MTHPQFVAAKDVKFFEIREISKGDGRIIYLKGLVFHSSLAVKSVEVKSEGGHPWVLVSLTPAAAGLSGRFEIEVQIQGIAPRILFGPEKHIIWPASQ